MIMTSIYHSLATASVRGSRPAPDRRALFSFSSRKLSKGTGFALPRGADRRLARSIDESGRVDEATLEIVGGALLRGLDVRFAAKTKLPVHIAEDPLRAVVRGTGIALKNIGRFKFLIP